LLPKIISSTQSLFFHTLFERSLVTADLAMLALAVEVLQYLNPLVFKQQDRIDQEKLNLVSSWRWRIYAKWRPWQSLMHALSNNLNIKYREKF